MHQFSVQQRFHVHKFSLVVEGLRLFYYSSSALGGSMGSLLAVRAVRAWRVRQCVSYAKNFCSAAWRRTNSVVANILPISRRVYTPVINLREYFFQCTLRSQQLNSCLLLVVAGASVPRGNKAQAAVSEVQLSLRGRCSAAQLHMQRPTNG